LQRKISRRRNRELVGHRFPILLSGPSPEHELVWEGRLQSQAEEIDGKTFVLDVPEGRAPQPGDFGTILITRAGDYDLFGMLESVEPRRAVSTEIPLATGAAVRVELPVLQ